MSIIMCSHSPILKKFALHVKVAGVWLANVFFSQYAKLRGVCASGLGDMMI